MLKKKYYYPTDKYFFITVQPNSSSFGSTVPNGTDKYLKDSSLSISATPNTGYIFSRWSDNDTNASRTVTVIEDKTYTAIFTLPNYTVTYNGNDNTGGSVPTDSHSYSSGSEVEVLGNTGSLVKTGYTFLGWKMHQGGSGTLYNAGDTFNISGNTVLYAQWEETEYTINYYNYYPNGDTGDLSYDISQFESGVLSLDIPSTIGYTFGGWYKDESYTQGPFEYVYINPGDGQLGIGNHTLYGKWTLDKYYIYYTTTDGNTVEPNDTTKFGATYETTEKDPGSPASQKRCRFVFTTAPTIIVVIEYFGFPSALIKEFKAIPTVEKTNPNTITYPYSSA